MWRRAKTDPALMLQTIAFQELDTCLMIADADLKIVAITPAVRSLLKDVEAELKRDMPQFSVDGLVGCNVDALHRQPSHQRDMLRTLQNSHNATIKLAGRPFDLFITPLRQDGRRMGYVVKWNDARPRLVAEDYAAKMSVLGRSVATAEFTPDGILLDASESFLRLMGYTIDEVRGQPHSMFVDPVYRDSKAYVDFWAALRGGQYQMQRFRRMAKGGREVWIEGAYNPIYNPAGKLVKVAKFVTDITAQTTLLSNLQTLIGEVDGAVGEMTSEARSAGGAVEETLAKVQSVANSTEELAASISEIASSMATSRSATESAFEQIVGVARSTESLATAARAMNGIVELIRNVASQINLLALNATIEAARAGEAGKGFAVVASEVKSLAIQAARATEQISSEIDSIQNTSSFVVDAIGAIRGSVTTVRDSVTLAASAVEEQSAVTQNMSEAMRLAAGAVATVTGNIGGIDTAAKQASAAVSRTKDAAKVAAAA